LEQRNSLPASLPAQSNTELNTDPLCSVDRSQKEEFRNQQQLNSLADLYIGCVIPEQLSKGREEVEGGHGNKLVN
jgi:hypothetical protein